MKRNKTAAVGAVLILLSVILAAGCDFLPAPLAEYDYTKNGAPGYFYDDFEEEENGFSSKYYYELEGSIRPSISTSYSHSGNNSIYLPTVDSALSFSIDAAEGGTFSFWARPDSSADTDTAALTVNDLAVNAELTAIEVDDNNSYYNNKWYQYSLDLEKGLNKLTIDLFGYYLDDFLFDTPMTGATPGEGALYYKSSPSFDWPDFAGAGKYHLQAASSPDFADPLIDVDSLIESSYSPQPALAEGSRYYWRIREYRNDCWSFWKAPRSFMICGDFTDESFESGDDFASLTNDWYISAANSPSIDSYSDCAEFSGFNSGKSSFSTIVNCTGESDLVFRYFYNDARAGELYFHIDDEATLIGPLSGYSWGYCGFHLPAGEHVIKFENIRAPSVSDSSYSFYIDDISVGVLDALSSDDFESYPPGPITGRSWLLSEPNEADIVTTESYSGSKSLEIREHPVFCRHHSAAPSYLSFYAKKTDYYSNLELNINIDSGPKEYPLKRNYWSAYVLPLDPGNSFICFRCDRNYGIYLDDVAFRDYKKPVSDSFESGDLSANDYISDNTYISVTDAASCDGTKALQISAYGTTSYEHDFFLPVVFDSPAKLTFGCRVDETGDTVVFSLDDEEISRSSSTSWTDRGPYDIPAGTHILKWTLEKGYTPSSAYGWIDNIRFTE